MSTPHNAAEKGQFAKVCLMPGDPLRAKFIAENFLEDAVLVTGVRGMNGYTGKYKGHPVSVMGHGMGMPSVGIYTYELYAFYGVEKIIRIGSAGGMHPDLDLGDVVVAQGAGTGTVNRNITDVVQALFDVEAHKVKVVKMDEGAHISE